MELLKTKTELRKWRQGLPPGATLGFVPTMGALHEGHMRLMHASLAENTFTLASIFVNPLQFGPQEDFQRYPRPFDADREKLAEAGVHALFAPEPSHFYEPDHRTFCEVRDLDRHLCGASRSGHFSGVCTVVLKLFQLAQCHHSYFGQKDIQQALILRRMVRDLSLDQELHIVETIREPSGLALSSRNRYLDEGERNRAAYLSRGLFAAEKSYAAGEKNAEKLKDCVRTLVLAAYPTRIEYIECVDQDGLAPLPYLDRPAVLALAVHFGKTRLIDNILLP